jgi:osmotically inducible lipoprotein OsmB
MKELHMKNLVIVLMLIFTLGLFGCAGMSDTEQRTLSGAAIGTAAGAVIGAISGNAGWGAAIGAAAGAGGGYLYDKNEKSKEAAYQKGYEDAQRK